MSFVQAFLLGAMVAWTPGLVFLAYVLWRAPFIEGQSEIVERDPNKRFTTFLPM